MEQSISERTKWVSRTLATISALLGLKTGLGLVQYLFSSNITFSAGNLFFGFIVVVLATALCSFFFWLAVRLWTDPKPRHIRLWALMPAIVVFYVVSIYVGDGIESWLKQYWPDADFIGIGTEVAAFEGLLLAGIVYVAVKRLLFYLLERTEIFTPIDFRRNRKRYFFWLSFFFWGMLFAVAQLLDEIGYIDISKDWWFPFAALLLPLLAAVYLYKFCVNRFVTKPLKTLQISPKDLNNGSPGCSGAEPGN